MIIFLKQFLLTVFNNRTIDCIFTFDLTAPSQSSDNQRNSDSSDHFPSGRITPPATNLPRFKKYNVTDFNFLKVSPLRKIVDHCERYLAAMTVLAVTRATFECMPRSRLKISLMKCSNYYPLYKMMKSMHRIIFPLSVTRVERLYINLFEITRDILYFVTRLH